jgi:ketosteroid isomerase-like protein
VAAARRGTCRRALDSTVLGLCEVRDGQLARAQMFYFDPRAVTEFLGRAAARRA